MNFEWEVRIYNIEWDSPDLSNYDWYCDSCNAFLNNQDGFDFDCGTWECTECGCENDIDEYNIREDLPSDEDVTVCCDHDSAIDEAVAELERRYHRGIYSFGAEILNDDEEDEDNEDDIPEGCAACGGPYPSCKISCPLFDDED
ncbi:hypothetical protein MR511_01840 [bacterium]|nr:hypothetical protein [bacterium]